MAQGDKKEQAKANAPAQEVEVAGDAQKAPREQTVGDTVQPQVRPVGMESVVSVGEQAAIVNPLLDTLSVSIPVGYNEDGTTKADTFNKGVTYEVDPKLLEVHNTEGVQLLVDPAKFYAEGGGE